MQEIEFCPQWIEAARTGDQSAICALYQFAYRSVYLTIKSMLKGDEETVLDLLQDTFLKAFGSLEQLGDPERFLAWIKTIARNQTRDWLKKTKPMAFSDLVGQQEEAPEFQLEDEDIYHLPEVVADRRETARLIHEILNTLTESQRMAIGMYYYQELTVNQVAQEMGVKAGTVKALLSQGRKRIRDRVEALAKQGTKLYGLSPMGFLLWLLRDCQVAPDGGILEQLLGRFCSGQGLGPRVTAREMAKKTVETAGRRTAMGVSTAGHAVTVKILSILAAVTILGGGAVGGVFYLSGQNAVGASTLEASGSGTLPGEENAEPQVPEPDPMQESGTEQPEETVQQPEETAYLPHGPEDVEENMAPTNAASTADAWETVEVQKDDPGSSTGDAPEESPDGSGEILTPPVPDQDASAGEITGNPAEDLPEDTAGDSAQDAPEDTAGDSAQDAPEDTVVDTPQENPPAEEETPEGITWELSADGVLTISGTGAMENYEFIESTDTVSGTAPWASEWDKIRQVIISDGITSIGDYAFYYFTNLTSVDIASTVTSIGNSAFSHCTSLASVELPAALTTLGSMAFDSCTALTQIDIPSGVTAIELYTFSGCTGLTSITLPDGIQRIDLNAFAHCTGLTHITLPAQLTTLASWAFSDCSSLTEITIPDGVTCIGSAAFTNCTSLARVELPEQLTTIELHGFNNCSSLTEITIPAGVTDIGQSVFANCTALTAIHFTGNAPSMGTDVFSGISPLPTLYYPAGNASWTQEVLTTSFSGLSAVAE